jgi:hypothetical protein
MAAIIVDSPRAVAMSVYVMRALLRLREELLARTELEKRLAEMERTLVGHNAALKDIYRKLKPLLLPPPAPPKPGIDLPRGLVHIVDRRVVVDQATEAADELLAKFKSAASGSGPRLLGTIARCLAQTACLKDNDPFANRFQPKGPCGRDVPAAGSNPTGAPSRRHRGRGCLHWAGRARRTVCPRLSGHHGARRALF